MTKSQLFKAAHKMTKEIVAIVGDYRVAFSYSLKTLYNAEDNKMSTLTMAEKLIELGGNEWIRGENHRIYVNNWTEFAELEITRYKTGNISNAKFRGESLSNNKANKMAYGKLFWDVKSEQWVREYFTDTTAVDYAIKKIEEAVK